MQHNTFRLAWATDIHLEFCDDAVIAGFLRSVTAAQPDALLITGDIGIATNVTQFLARISSVLDCPVNFVLGNHDFYRGSIDGVRSAVSDVTGHSARLRWLRAGEVVTLIPRVALIGVDGWADARFGDYDKSTVPLNDYVLIDELSGIDAGERRRRLQMLGDAEAAFLDRQLRAAVVDHDRIIVGIHVPPFAEAAWHEGRQSDDNWLPHFSCKACGDVLLAVANEHAHREFTVLCGHTHGGGVVDVRPNLNAVTGAAEYGAPRVQQVFEILARV